MRIPVSNRGRPNKTYIFVSARAPAWNQSGYSIRPVRGVSMGEVRPTGMAAQPPRAKYKTVTATARGDDPRY